MIESYETFEYLSEPQICESTASNLKTLERRRWEKLNSLWDRYLHGGSSPKKTYLQMASRYTDVDTGYAQIGDE
jgi:hypothetical protein